MVQLNGLQNEEVPLMSKLFAGIILVYYALYYNGFNPDFTNQAMIAGVALFAFGLDDLCSKKQ